MRVPGKTVCDRVSELTPGLAEIPITGSGKITNKTVRALRPGLQVVRHTKEAGGMVCDKDRESKP